MSMFHIVYIPQTPIHDRTKHSKGNGSNLKVAHDTLPPIDPVTGKRLRDGNGCHLIENCFECPDKYKDKCRYDKGMLAKKKREQNEKDTTS